MQRPVFWLLALFLLLGQAPAAENLRSIGTARIEVTPEFPIRLTGYVARKELARSAFHPLWAKAIAIGSDAESPAIIITVDNCGVCANVVDEVAARLKAKAGISRERFTVCSSHTHSGPQTIGFAPNIFGFTLPPDQQAAIERYTKQLTDKLEAVALAALKDRQPATLAWSQGTATFAKNRRTQNGPVDHAYAMLRVTDKEGKTRALLGNYACHCTTLGGEIVQACGDWAGFAQEYIERDNPGAVALISIGCGADSNPNPRGGPDFGLALAKQHGEELARETKRLLAGEWTALPDKLNCNFQRIELPFQNHFTRAEWEERARQKDIVGYHAQRWLEQLDRGEKLPLKLPYPVQTWSFGDKLAMVFLGGEVVVDYALRLKRDFDASRLWVTAYANDVPCYIPSKRILAEGGYEAESSLWYYGRPGRLAPETEDLVIKTVHSLMPKAFLSDKRKADFPAAKSPAEALATIKTKPNLVVELVAAEPLVVDPVAIDFGLDGRLWVVEMNDYPSGLDGQGKPGGRVKLLTDENGDGKYDRASTFLTDLPFPTGLMAWRNGVLVCAAPDIIYAEDTDGDGKADLVKKLYSGFATHNFQARVNGLSYGMDNWVYGSSGLFGGKITSALTGKTVDVSGRDFRFQPDTGEFEPAGGLSQQGRIQDDFGHWFGNDNSTLLWQYPLPDSYVRRNANFTPSNSRTYPPKDTDPNQLYPISHTLQRFNDPAHANHTTSACGPGLYRDELLGAEFVGNAFVCEPVHNLVRRLVITPDGATFAARKAGDEQTSEFLASTDNWFRPVQVRTGPDGALWVVDMYRFVIEHPRWITPERLAELDPRAGADMGRIYRVYPRGEKPRPIQNLAKLKSAELAAALDSPNGTTRDMIQQALVLRKDRAAEPVLERLTRQSARPAVRAQAMATLQGLGRLSSGVVAGALKDQSPDVLVAAIRLSEPFIHPGAKVGNREVKELVFALSSNSDPRVAYQLALTLGESDSAKAGEALQTILSRHGDDPWIRAAVLSSAMPHAEALLQPLLAVLLADDAAKSNPPPGSSEAVVIQSLIKSIHAKGKLGALNDLLVKLSAACERQPTLPRIQVADSLLDSWSPGAMSGDGVNQARKNLGAVATRVALDAVQAEATRLAAIRLLAKADTSPAVTNTFQALLSPAIPLPLQLGAADGASRLRQPAVPALLLAGWEQHSPALRSKILSVLLARDEWIGDVLQAAEKNQIAPGEIPVAQRATLAKNATAAIRERAAKLFRNATGEDRSAVMARYQSATKLTGNVSHGAQLFTENCATCHAFHGLGHEVGPNLAALTDKSPPFLLASILDPNAAVDERFRGYQIETKDGQSLSGIIASETATGLTLVKAEGARDELLRTQIATIRASNLSLMPEGFEQKLPPQDMADLIAFLRSEAGVAAK